MKVNVVDVESVSKQGIIVVLPSLSNKKMHGSIYSNSKNI
jgi:hypothetical protein